MAAVASIQLTARQWNMEKTNESQSERKAEVIAATAKITLWSKVPVWNINDFRKQFDKCMHTWLSMLSGFNSISNCKSNLTARAILRYTVQCSLYPVQFVRSPVMHGHFSPHFLFCRCLVLILNTKWNLSLAWIVQFYSIQCTLSMFMNSQANASIFGTT